MKRIKVKVTTPVEEALKALLVELRLLTAQTRERLKEIRTPGKVKQVPRKFVKALKPLP
jgi:hypothetical protein